MAAATSAAGATPILIMRLVVRVAGITIAIMDTRVTLAGIMEAISAVSVEEGMEGITKMGARGYHYAVRVHGG